MGKELAPSAHIEWIDTAKGIAILAMVLGHILPPESFINKIIFSFHMPLFFIISGLTFKINNIGIKSYVYKKFMRLMIPYMFTSFFLYILWLTFSCPNPIKDTPIDAIAGIFYQDILRTLYGIGQVNIMHNLNWIAPIGPAWFLPCLFVSNIIFFILIKKNNTYAQIPFVVFFCLLSIFIGKYIYLPWSIDVALFGVVFIFIGYTSKLFLIKENYNLFSYIKKLNTPSTKPIKIICSILFCFIYINLVDNFDIISMNNRYYGNPIITAFIATLGSLIVICLSIFIKNNKLAIIFQHFGRNSMIVLLFHLFVINSLPKTSYLKYNDFIEFIFVMFSMNIIIIIFKGIPFLKKLYQVR